MTGIRELFRAFSEPDEFAIQVQLELFEWARGIGRREYWRDVKRQQRGVRGQVHRCSKCGEPGHRGVWRGRVICADKAAA